MADAAGDSGADFAPRLTAGVFDRNRLRRERLHFGLARCNRLASRLCTRERLRATLRAPSAEAFEVFSERAFRVRDRRRDALVRGDEREVCREQKSDGRDRRQQHGRAHGIQYALQSLREEHADEAARVEAPVEEWVCDEEREERGDGERYRCETYDARERRVNPSRAETAPRGGDEQKGQERRRKPERLEERRRDVRADAPCPVARARRPR
jgi:hypothetical protein